MAEAAQQVYLLSLSLQAQDTRSTNEEKTISDTFDLNGECLLYEGRREDVERSFGALQQDCNDEVCLTTPYVPIPHLL